MKITCLSRLFCRFQTFRLYYEPSGELLMWWLVDSVAVVRHVPSFASPALHALADQIVCGCPALSGLSCVCTALAGLSCFCPALFSVLFRGCHVVFLCSSQCPSRQTSCFRRQCYHVVASISAALSWPPTRDCCSELVPCLVPCGCSVVVRCLWVYD